jgi:UPF0042 nucleotide-binding protein
MELILISGMSGAGKATASKALEEHGYLVVDNLPPTLLTTLVPEIAAAGLTDKLCVVTDARSGKLVQRLDVALTELIEKGFSQILLFLDASNATLVSRFSENRKQHPFGTESRGVLAGIEHERGLLHKVKSLATTVIDTSEMTAEQLSQQVVSSIVNDGTMETGLLVSISSFGFKYGLPIDADLVFDVRFLANPFYEDHLRPYDGRNKVIDEFVMNDPSSGPYLEKMVDLLEFSLPRYVEEGKANLTVAIGCTGGRHRSVVISERLGLSLRALGYKVLTNHRDVSK